MAKEIGEGVKFFYNGEDTKRSGVGIAVAESLKDSVAAVQRISDRIMSLRLDTKENYWTVLSVYAPQTGCPAHEKDDFYFTLEEAIRSVPEGDYHSRGHEQSRMEWQKKSRKGTQMEKEFSIWLSPTIWWFVARSSRRVRARR
ncbi:unnamed protein product [Heligmosomoides polygyrus]|uniref:Cache_2 domain-containing protein n=1 Tax=Heligmosomoides polygyrus TaxID=6339 RepID=A0A183G1B2_HELPZ|nr:unnamed protein product [Heligmosomoides polygyrus]